MLNYISNIDFISKIILTILFFMSVFCWSITIYKFLILKFRAKQLRKIIKAIENSTDIPDLISSMSYYRGTFIGKIITNYLTAFQELLKLKDTNITYNELNDKYWQMLQSSISQNLENALQKEETSISFLSNSAQVAPLLGLFGTIWGLIYAFSALEDISNISPSSIPGIAEALVTTLFGLLVAIPALVFFNYLNKKIAIFNQKLISLTDKFYWKIYLIANINISDKEKDLYISNLKYQPERSIL